MRVIEKTIYQFDELTDAAKEKAREWFRTASAHDTQWSEFIIDDAKRIGALIGFDVDEIYWCGFGSQGDGACWTGSAFYAAGCAREVARECPQDSEIQRIAREWHALQRRNFYRVRCSVSASNMRASRTLADYTSVVDEESINRIVSDFADWIYRRLEQEYEYQMSDECVDKSISANEYEFDEEGERA